MPQKLLTVKDVAEQLNISDSGVKRLTDLKYIRYIDIGTAGSIHRRFTQEEIDRYVKDNLPKEFRMLEDDNDNEEKPNS